MNLAAETHADRSIDGPASFVHINIVGTFMLLEAALTYWRTLSRTRQAAFRFHHISTDEVFGTLDETGAFTEESPYRPSSPYSASKASSDHFVRAWRHTYGLPTLISNCSNNYGPYQLPEKLIPLMIINGREDKSPLVYDSGANVRAWPHVVDHARALHRVATAGRPGHDLRYAIDAARVERELGIVPTFDFETGLRRTVEWYLANESWWQPHLERRYSGERLGLVSGR